MAILLPIIVRHVCTHVCTSISYVDLNAFSDKPTVKNDAVPAEESTDLSIDEIPETIIKKSDSIKDNSSAQVSDSDILFYYIHLD